MTTRPANSADHASIIEILRQSLGESTIPKSEALWRWKHELNPFGPSYVLLAHEGDQLIGLRAFMQWHWTWKGKNYRAIRAVDTATHPDHQGKGIFKKLTLQQLELCKKDNVDFVFNTPNTQSMPGYLKMGWKEQGRMPLKMNIARPAKLFSAFILKNKTRKEPTDAPQNWDQLFKDLSTLQVRPSTHIHTPFSVPYISWRYATNPLFTYNYISDHKNYLLIYRFKAHAGYTEFRITDFFLFNDQPKVKKHIAEGLRKIRRSIGYDMLSFSGAQFLEYKSFLPYFGPIPVTRRGPIVTLRDVNSADYFDQLLDYQNWSYSLGDLELF